MAFTVNGIQVAGSGKSAYLYALAGGYTGTEEDFNRALANITSNSNSSICPLKFTYDTNTSTWSCDKTYEEIKAAFIANKFIYAIAIGKHRDYGATTEVDDYNFYLPFFDRGTNTGIYFIQIGYMADRSSLTPSGAYKTYGGLQFSEMFLSSSNVLTKTDKERIFVPYNYSIVLDKTKWDTSTKTLKYEGFNQIDNDERAQMITVVPATSSQAAYQAANVQVVARKMGYLTFGCDTIPTENLTVYVTIQGVTQL